MRYVKLGDGTMGILPQEWMERFAEYFRTCEIADDRIRIPKSLYAQVDELFAEEVLSEEVLRELRFYKEKVAKFEQIESIEPPEALQTELRDYQKQGLNWLNFLDEFGFGGCLADDMGLGKTVQVLAFILSQKEKRGHHTNLIVVPTSLIFNWIAEVEKFAPSLKITTIHGANRVKNTDSFSQFDIILTTYGTLLSDITFMKKYRFQAIFLDESQAIKNPESKRYKAVRLFKLKTGLCSQERRLKITPSTCTRNCRLPFRDCWVRPSCSTIIMPCRLTSSRIRPGLKNCNAKSTRFCCAEPKSRLRTSCPRKPRWWFTAKWEPNSARFTTRTKPNFSVFWREWMKPITPPETCISWRD